VNSLAKLKTFGDLKNGQQDVKSIQSLISSMHINTKPNSHISATNGAHKFPERKTIGCLSQERVGTHVN
jgi:hypothetical protein